MEILISLNFWLWAATAVLALLYLMAGTMKATRPIPMLAGMMRWPGDVPAGFVRFVGISEVLGAIGLVLPLVTGIMTFLAPVAAICLSIIQILAIGFHARRGETRQTLILNLLFLSASVFVVWGRRAELGLF